MKLDLFSVGKKSCSTKNISILIEILEKKNPGQALVIKSNPMDTFEVIN